jgi:cytochrome P450
MSTLTTVRPFEALPVLTPPNNYAREIPLFLAEAAQEHGPVFAIGWPHGKTVYFVGPEANRFILGAHREYFSHDLGWTPIIGDLFGHGLLNMDGEEHSRHRKMMNPAFTIAYMERYLPIMNRVIAERTAAWVAQDYVDLYDECRKITFDVAAEALVGFSTGDQVDALREGFYSLLYADFDSTEETYESFFARQLHVRDAVKATLLPLIAARRSETESGDAPNDVLGMLIRARDDSGDSLDDEQLLAHLYILLIAGHETSTSLSAWLLYLLATHPEYLRRVHAELDQALPQADSPITLEATKGMRQLGNALTEAGRLYSPVAVAPRGVVKDFDFGGYRIPAGINIYYSPSGSHRLPHVFAEPNAFDPDRFAPPREEDKRTPYGMALFGGGPRICIGVNMATVEIKALAARVLSRYTLDVLPGQNIAQLYYGVTGIIPEGIKVRVTPRIR